MIEIPKWLFYSILTFLILLQFPLSYILGRLLGEITLRRRMSHSMPTQYNHDSPNHYEDRYNRIHPTAVTQPIEQNPDKKRDKKPNSKSQNSQPVFGFIAHLGISFLRKSCTGVYHLFRRSQPKGNDTKLWPLL